MKLTATEQQTLLALARQAIIDALRGDDGPCTPPESAGLTSHCGCFVTIRQHGRLRGCLGNFTSERPLYQEVTAMAVAAATTDPRFAPMTPADLDNFTLEISVLSPLRKIATPTEVEVGKHGLYLVHGMRRGVLLPQVATEYGWDRETFLDHTCLKAGLPLGAWRDKQTAIFVFEAEVFAESYA